jgi:hypothetical protein
MSVMFDSIGAFYRAEEARRHAPEADYGVMWTNATRWPQWRVSYNQTGDLFAVELAGEKRVELIGFIVPDDPVEGHDPESVSRAITHPWYRTADEVLEGWADACHGPQSLQWVRSRVQAHEAAEMAV